MHEPRGWSPLPALLSILAILAILSKRFPLFLHMTPIIMVCA
jgi:hypothetical protein